MAEPSGTRGGRSGPGGDESPACEGGWTSAANIITAVQGVLAPRDGGRTGPSSWAEEPRTPPGWCCPIQTIMGGVGSENDPSREVLRDQDPAGDLMAPQLCRLVPGAPQDQH